MERASSIMFKNENQVIIQDQITGDSKTLTSNKKETEGKKPSVPILGQGFVQQEDRCFTR